MKGKGMECALVLRRIGSLAMILAALAVCTAVSAAPVLEVGESDGGGGGELTRIRFTIRGPYSGPVEFFQFKTVKYFQRIEQETSSPAEYEAAVPAVFDSMPFNVRVDSVSHAVNARMMGAVSAVDPGLFRIFDRARLDRAAGVKAAVIIVLYILCAGNLMRLKRGAGRALAVGAATLIFSLGELFVLWNGVDEKTAILHERKTGAELYSYEFVGLGCPWGGRGRLERDNGVIFPVYETISGLFGDNLRIELSGRGSSVEDFVLERGTRRVFCCIISGGLEGGVIMRDGEIVNATKLDIQHAYMWDKGRLLDLGEVPAGGRSNHRDAEEVTRKNVLGEAEAYLDPAALRLLAWRMRKLDLNGSVVFGFAPPSHVIFFEVTQDDKLL